MPPFSSRRVVALSLLHAYLVTGRQFPLATALLASKIWLTCGQGSTLAGSDSGVSGTADGSSGVARFNDPRGVAASPDGVNLFVADYSNHAIRQVVISTGATSTLAGLGCTCVLDAPV